MKRKKDKSLTGFIKDNCANYDRHYESCLFAESCKVFNGKRCAYFERRVLGPPGYPYRIPGYDYSRLFAEYAEVTKKEKLSNGDVDVVSHWNFVRGIVPNAGKDGGRKVT